MAQKTTSPRTRRRAIDSSVDQTYTEFHSRFALVTKARANIWLTTAMVLFVIGLIIGAAVIVNPTAFFEGNLASNQSDAAFLSPRGATVVTTGSAQRVVAPVTSTRTTSVNSNPGAGSPTQSNPAGGSSDFTPTLSVSATAARDAGTAGTVVTTRFNITWDCHLPNNTGSGRVDKRVNSAITNVSVEKRGTTYTEITVHKSESPDPNTNLIYATCTPPGQQPVVKSCRVTPGTAVGQAGTASCDGGPSICNYKAASVSAVANQTVTDGHDGHFTITVTNNSTCNSGISIYQRPLDGSAGAWNFGATNEDPDYMYLPPGTSKPSKITISPYDYITTQEPESVHSKQLTYEVLTMQKVYNNDGTYVFPCNLKTSTTFKVTVNRPSPDPTPTQARVVAGLVSPPQCDVDRTPAGSTTTYTGPDDGSQDNSSDYANQNQNTTPPRAYRSNPIWRVMCYAIYGRNAEHCQQ